MGYLGYRKADQVLISSLRRLEYRGYDSWGIATAGSDGIGVYKQVGSISEVEAFDLGDSSLGIGHTRWATHGAPSEINAHPHLDCNRQWAVVHNGIIENFLSLREQLRDEGHRFVSETDTEVIAHLMEKNGGDLEDALAASLKELKGSYAIVVMGAGERKLVGARYKSPLILGVGDGEYFLASDATAILEYTNRAVYLEDGDFVVVTDEGYRIKNQGRNVEREVELIPWDPADAEKEGYDHFMLKEIHETPRVIEDTLLGHISETVDLDLSLAVGTSEIVFLACGTSFHAALLGRYIIEEVADLPVRVECASEFNYRKSPLNRTLVIAITQSGETADTLQALRKAKSFGARALAITNVLGSSVTRLADEVIYTRAGPEIGVAATKTFTAQLIVIYLIAAKLSRFSRTEMERFLLELRLIPEKIQRVLDNADKIQAISKILAGYENMMYIGRKIGYPTALEGALKMKEISYIHAEGYPAGELKHGPFALLGERTPVVASVVRDETYDIMLNNIKEVRARGSPVIAIADEGDEEVEKYVDFVIKTPEVESIFTPLTHTVALQLLAYYTAKERGCEIDRPKNLAKSVTVE
ncbi:MAG: glutamine--fructose-6-phosphate aminotransferase [Candidatus Syntrophoarchaeum butanivorans]|uniref:Glutamine--fructose-6-phosphate aminotransferase [isomerizing] n=1 Tax=Candidatus Syntropharchaeum butanivorans TaxID=1839936 RepID=A0A1F2P7T6_9EURY|nr:MAG: glutamine--fructose-6-phosphate aminotransferase [Candidatus Syntrophoarchaeum butanivorans]